MNHKGNLLDKKAKELYLSGLSLNQIAKQYNISSTSVNRKLTKLGVKKRSASDYIHPKRKNSIRTNLNDIIRLYTNKHQSLRVIGEKFGVSGACIGRILRENGVSTRKTGTKLLNWYEYDVLQICADYINEVLTKDICKKHNITKPILYTILRKNDIPLRHKQRTYNAVVSSYKSKEYKLPSGELIFVQGYENDFLDYVFQHQQLLEEDIVYRPPTITYKDEKHRSRKYFPDFYIPKLNLIVEIKSSYILKKQTQQNFECKKQACLDQGYEFICILDKDYEKWEQLI